MKPKRISKERTARRRAINIDDGIYPVCEGCRDRRIFPHILQQHHVTPLSEMTADDGRVICFLCPNCHAFVHLIRKRIQKRLRLGILDDLDFWLDGRTERDIAERLTAIAAGDTNTLIAKHGFMWKKDL